MQTQPIAIIALIANLSMDVRRRRYPTLAISLFLKKYTSTEDPDYGLVESLVAHASKRVRADRSGSNALWGSGAPCASAASAAAAAYERRLDLSPECSIPSTTPCTIPHGKDASLEKRASADPARDQRDEDDHRSQLLYPGPDFSSVAQPTEIQDCPGGIDSSQEIRDCPVIQALNSLPLAKAGVFEDFSNSLRRDKYFKRVFSNLEPLPYVKLRKSKAIII